MIDLHEVSMNQYRLCVSFNTAIAQAGMHKGLDLCCLFCMQYLYTQIPAHSNMCTINT